MLQQTDTSIALILKLSSIYETFRSTLDSFAWVHCPPLEGLIILRDHTVSLLENTTAPSMMELLKTKLQSWVAQVESRNICHHIDLTGTLCVSELFMIDVASSTVTRRDLDETIKRAMYASESDKMCEAAKAGLPIPVPEIHMDSDGQTEIFGVRRAYILAAFIFVCSCSLECGLDNRPTTPMMNKDELFRHVWHHDLGGLHTNHLAVDIELSNLSISLIHAVGLNPQSALASDMDDLDPRFICGTCNSRSQLDWRHAVRSSQLLVRVNPFTERYHCLFRLLTIEGTMAAVYLDRYVMMLLRAMIELKVGIHLRKIGYARSATCITIISRHLML